MKRTLTTLLLASLVAAPIASIAGTPRQSAVERNSEHVMPFSMSATMHHFVPTPNGGRQSVTARSGDRHEIRLIRSHLRTEAARFAHGDFRDPTSIHGSDMPGVRAMHDGAARIAVRYADLENGGEIAYATADPALVAAIHAWFRAQVSDHGSHAMMKM